MGIPVVEQRKLAMLSGNVCAFPGCGLQLTVEAPDGDQVILGEMAHIVAESPNGPRGTYELTPAQRNLATNLLLLCNRHHQLIDDAPGQYTVDKLLQMKADHETAIAKGLASRAIPPVTVPVARRTDVIYSTMLEVARMPMSVFGAPCAARSEREVQPVRAGRVMTPFILRGGMLWAFQDLRDAHGPFAGFVDRAATEEHDASEWWDDPDHLRWFQQLLNRGLNKLTGRHGLRLDAKHHRYYFSPEVLGQPRYQTYRPLNTSKATRAVVWQPTKRSTGEPRNYWLHRAVSLRFDRVAASSWVLSVRPELRVTLDGETELASEEIGRRVTRKKSRMFNYDLLGEVQFWRDYLSDSQHRIVLNFGPARQRLVISTAMVAAEVSWPGIPDEYAMGFANVEYLDDLFSWAEAEDDSDADDDCVYFTEADDRAPADVSPGPVPDGEGQATA